MDKKSKILVGVMAVLVLGAALLTYYRTMVVRDFEVMTSEEEPVPEDEGTEEIIIGDGSGAAGTFEEGYVPENIPQGEEIYQ